MLNPTRRRHILGSPGALAGAACLSAASVAGAQTAPIPQQIVRVPVNSSVVQNNGPVAAVVYSTLVESRGAAWLRLKFDGVVLSGDRGAPDASYLRITSVLDSGQQTLTASQLADWNDTTAYFNGDSVILELVAYPGTGANSIVMSEAWAGVPGGVTDTICGPTDDRVLSSDPRTARLMPIGCTAWLINDAQHCFLTAGHCISTGTTNAVVQFNVPLSLASGTPVNPPPQHQYSVQQASIRSNGGAGTGNDMAYFGALANSTGNNPYQNQQAAFTLMNAPAGGGGQQIRVTGYGTGGSAGPTWSQVQKTHVGPYVALSGTTVQYATDTTGGNSGSPVIHESTGNAIAIHTHGGCTSSATSPGANIGTAIQHATLQGYLANPGGVCIPTACYANCDGVNGLTIADFGCFQTKFVAGDPYADCTQTGGLTVADFGCFQTKFVAGCP